MRKKPGCPKDPHRTPLCIMPPWLQICTTPPPGKIFSTVEHLEHQAFPNPYLRTAISIELEILPSWAIQRTMSLPSTPFAPSRYALCTIPLPVLRICFPELLLTSFFLFRSMPLSKPIQVIQVPLWAWHLQHTFSSTNS